MDYDPVLTAFIRDIAIIVTSIMVALAALTFMVVLLRMYGPARRSVRNFEAASRLALDAAARVSGIVNLGSEFAALIWGLVERVRGGRQDDEGNGKGNGGASSESGGSGSPPARR